MRRQEPGELPVWLDAILVYVVWCGILAPAIALALATAQCMGR
jgi:hypothetical protein